MIETWGFDEENDLVIFRDSDHTIFQKPNGEIRILERVEYSVTNRSPMYLEEVLIRELMEYKAEYKKVVGVRDE
jgi:hypothetical protein